MRAGKGDFYREVPLNKPVRDVLEIATRRGDASRLGFAV